MTSSQETFDKIKSILGKLDRGIDAARRSRLAEGSAGKDTTETRRTTSQNDPEDRWEPPAGRAPAVPGSNGIGQAGSDPEKRAG